MARNKSSASRLQQLIREATVDCHDQWEEYQGVLNMIEDNVVCPFPAKVIGEPVEVGAVEGAPEGLGVQAVCRYKGKDYRIDIGSLEWPKQRPAGFEWIEAYFEWQKNVW